MKRTIEKFLVQLLPATLYRFLGGLYGYLIPPTISYSQYGEDLIIENFFKKKNFHSGVYVDIGAFHPRWLSNTHRLYKSGWKGSVVDIDSHKIKLFQVARSYCTGIIAAVTPSMTGSILNVYRFRRLWSEIDTLSLDDAERQKKDFGIDFDKGEIKTISINEVLRMTTEQYGTVSFVNIDIEGLDEAILFDLDFEKYKPELICFENNLYFSGSEKLKDLLNEKGYQHLFTSGGTHGYARI